LDAYTSYTYGKHPGLEEGKNVRSHLRTRFALRAAVVAGLLLATGIFGRGNGGPSLSTDLASADTTNPPLVAFLDGTATANITFRNTVDATTTALTDYTFTDLTTGQTIPITAATNPDNPVNPHAKLLSVSLASAPDVTHKLGFQYQGSKSVTATPRLVLNDPQYFYAGSDLGATWKKRGTSFRLWAPVASAVVVNVYKDENGTPLTAKPMTKSVNGTWVATITGNLKNRYWDYSITNFGVTKTATDPYATGAATQGTYGMIVDLPSTNPKGWSKDHYLKTRSPTDASLYEVHVRDFSIDRNSGMKNKGRYLAFTERGTKGPGGLPTGVDYLKKLGITHVEILPIQVGNVLQEASAINQSYPAPNLGTFYNWNYDPKMYDVPDAAYATSTHGTARIAQVKQMVQGLHRAGIGVILDVVYNHTNNSDNFNAIVPGYYYRTDPYGFVADEAGPAVAAERPMVRKFIVDSASYWMKQYHVDGFRFDLLTLLGKGTAQALSTALHKIDPNCILLGEPWDIAPGGWLLKNFIQGDVELTQGQQRGMRIGVFNDQIRNGLEGNVFNAAAPGYATGDPTQSFPVEVGIVGNTDYGPMIRGWANKPEEAINYVSSHDNYTLWDRLQKDPVPTDDATRIKMDELANAAVFTSQGVPFMQGGDEFLRTKKGDGNSYASGDLVNQFDWSLPRTNASVVAYYSGLIHLRRVHPAFRMNSAALIASHLKFLNAPTQVTTIEFELTGHANKDPWKNIVVAYNPHPDPVSVTLPSGTWTVVATTGKVGEKKLGSASGSASVPGYTMMVFHQ
jgi:pullulanase